MDYSHSLSPSSEGIFQYSPLKNKLKKHQQNSRPCQKNFPKSANTQSPCFTNFKSSAFPKIYNDSYVDSKLSVKCPPEKHQKKSSSPSKSNQRLSNYKKFPSIITQKETAFHKSFKKFKEDSLISHLVQLSRLKTSRIKIELDKNYRFID